MSVPVSQSDNKKIVLDHDFLMVGGFLMPITLDESQGDYIEELNDRLIVHLTAKANKTNPEVILPAEEITVFKQHLAAIQKRRREVVELTPEQQFEWNKTFKEMVSNKKH